MVFSVDRNSEIEKRSKNISADLRIGEVETDKDLLIVHVMQSLAREEGEFVLLWLMPFAGTRKTLATEVQRGVLDMSQPSLTIGDRSACI